MKKIQIKRVEPILLEFSDKESYEVIFNMEAIATFQELIGAIEKEASDIRNQEMLKYILYAGIKVNSEITLEEAGALAFVMDAKSGQWIINEFIENITAGLTEEQKLQQKKMMARFLAQNAVK